LELRKIQKAGGERECLQVTIPKKYCDNLGIRIGDYVQVELEKSGVYVSPINMKDDRKNS
tara:strand:- start:1640 stop:1819 length:180 start_codon:yes stop_codon:yes gene_type:complete